MILKCTLHGNPLCLNSITEILPEINFASSSSRISIAVDLCILHCFELIAHPIFIFTNQHLTYFLLNQANSHHIEFKKYQKKKQDKQVYQKFACFKVLDIKKN